MSTRLFALAMPGRPELFPFDDEAARFYRQCGYTGIYLENDRPRFGQAAAFGGWRGLNEVVSLWRFSRDESARQYIEWVRDQADIAHRNDLLFYLKIWEPRVPIPCRDQIPPDARGPRKDSKVKCPPPNVCLMAPAGERLIRAFHQEAFRQLEMIDGVIAGVADNFAELCGDACPYCAGVPVHDRVVRYFNLLTEVAAAVCPDLDVMLYDWWWADKGFRADNIISRYLATTDAACRVVTRFTQWARQDLPAYDGPGDGILDCTLTVDGPGALTESYLPAVSAARLRLLDMISVGNSSEAWAHPPAPAPQIFLKRLSALEELGFDGFVDYDCSTLVPGIVAEAIRQYMNGEAIPDPDTFLNQLADETYGPDAVATARQGWAACKESLHAYPLDMDSAITDILSGRMGFSMALTIGMIPDLALFAGKDYGANPIVFYPYSALAPDVIKAQEEQLALVAEAMTRAADLLARAVDLADRENKSFALREADRASALSLMYQSQHNWAGIARKVYSGATVTPPDEPGWVRQALLTELDVTIRYARLYQNDRMLFSNPTWDVIGLVQLCEPERAIDRDRPFDDKIAMLSRRLDLT